MGKVLSMFIYNPLKKVSRNSVEDSPESPVPVDKSRGDNRLGRSVKPQERFQR